MLTNVQKYKYTKSLKDKEELSVNTKEVLK